MDWIEDLKRANIGKVKVQEPLANHTTWKIGGPADVLVIPDSMKNLEKAMSIITQNEIPWLVIGRGSNLLVGDGGIEGVVIKLDRGMDNMKVEGETVTVGGGYSTIKLATLLSRQGLSGLEFAGGIPGSVGGAVFMNAGAHGKEIADILLEATILKADGSLEVWTKDEMDFAYRTSRLQKEKGICVEAVLQLKKGDRSIIVKEMQANKDYRRDSQPWNHPTCGSVFRNPLPFYAGQLIEEAGLKGYQIGGAQISLMHANFIENVNQATAKDVIDLINHAKKVIQETKQIELKTEVEMIGKHS
ncbi:UDP-N-acetylmuramate dehydrogenase [Halalkalibacter hemicellulosilyticus]|uniref:UDP-N-acetylenolpyruvoylglucosamine reductase n=1 Tax=Halalkalibacter hemicellulosilyticusJCM 9152 TaxID=1236971 RepID=W4QB06_9BACI|nr:UDP-N-acetylmuramate dehydrogenase [Halalkalibacter hemicellulosilyticus]GAE29152.1 UDP-N-acetylenolpyruvoylglucosamine reductase [Halalkalibacter hemicellulosilyticusJCM 9152]